MATRVTGGRQQEWSEADQAWLDMAQPAARLPNSFLAAEIRRDVLGRSCGRGCAFVRGRRWLRWRLRRSRDFWTVNMGFWPLGDLDMNMPRINSALRFELILEHGIYVVGGGAATSALSMGQREMQADCMSLDVTGSRGIVQGRVRGLQMKKALLLAATFAAALLAGCSHPQPVYAPPPPPAIDFQAVQQQGFHDGFEAARNDVAVNRPPSFEAHPRFRNPPVPGPAWPAYRQGFRAGYDRFLHPNAPPPY